MKLFPASTIQQIEFDNVKELVAANCRTEYGKHRVENIRIHTRKEFIIKELQQTNEFKVLTDSNQFFPNDFTLNISKEVKLLSIPGATLSGEQFLLLRRLSENTANIFRWFDKDRKLLFPGLSEVIADTYHAPPAWKPLLARRTTLWRV